MSQLPTGAPPLFKLQRLREIHTALRSPVASAEALTALKNEASEILASVGMVPAELMGLNEPSTWAGVFASMFRQVDRETAEHWFVNAMLTAAAAGHAEGLEAGKAHARNALGFDELVACLRLVRDGIKAGRIQSAKVNDTADASKPPRPLVELVVEVLAGVGVTS